MKPHNTYNVGSSFGAIVILILAICGETKGAIFLAVGMALILLGKIVDLLSDIYVNVAPLADDKPTEPDPNAKP